MGAAFPTLGGGGYLSYPFCRLRNLGPGDTKRILLSSFRGWLCSGCIVLSGKIANSVDTSKKKKLICQ